jgi:hypothetical protein
MAATTPKAGRFGVVYIGATNGATAVNRGNITNWTFDYPNEQFDVTCMGDNNKTYVSGIPDATGGFDFVWDSATANVFYVAARDGLSRKMYLYPGGSSANYWYGDVLLSGTVTGGTGDAVRGSGSWQAASDITPIGTV